MKKHFIIVIIFCIACFKGFTQSVTITPTSPRMTVKGGGGQQGLDLSTNDQYANVRVLQNSLSTVDKDMYFGFLSGTTSTLHLYSNNNETITVKDLKVGIRHTDPHAPLQFENSLVNRKIVLYETANDDHQYVGFGNTFGEFRYQSNRPGTSHVFYSAINATSSKELMRIKGDGNVGIGTNNPVNKLDVLGTIRANELIIETGWADYVFEKDFRLKPLTEVENFIKENKHLPDVPSAKTIQENGAYVSELMTKMMQKIEELTLYSIQQEKKINALEKHLADKK